MLRTILTIAAACAIAGSSWGFQSNARSAKAPGAKAPTWARAPIGSSEMTAEFPGAVKPTAVPLEGQVRASYDILETLSFASETFAAFASYAVTKANKPISLDGAARGALDRVKGQADAPDYKETITKTTVLGLPGRKIQCSFTAGDKKVFLSGLIFTDRARMWQVICTGEANSENTSVSQRVLSSIKRTSGKS